MFDNRFTFLCSEEDKSNLAKIAAFFRRSQSDAIRLLLRMAIEDIAKKAEANERINNEKPIIESK